MIIMHLSPHAKLSKVQTCKNHMLPLFLPLATWDRLGWLQIAVFGFAGFTMWKCLRKYWVIDS